MQNFFVEFVDNIMLSGLYNFSFSHLSVVNLP